MPRIEELLYRFEYDRGQGWQCIQEVDAGKVPRLEARKERAYMERNRLLERRCERHPCCCRQGRVQLLLAITRPIQRQHGLAESYALAEDVTAGAAHDGSAARDSAAKRVVRERDALDAPADGATTSEPANIMAARAEVRRNVGADVVA